MATSIDSKRLRRTAILELIETGGIHSQAELAQRLADRDLVANQATLSRDLRDMGVVKGRDGYQLPTAPSPADEDVAEVLSRALETWVRSAVAAVNQVVVRTPPGGAQPLALAIDNAVEPNVLGTVGGDDTVLVICPNEGAADALATRFMDAAGLVPAGREHVR